MAIEMEARLLDEDYVRVRLNDITEIKHKEIKVNIYHSDNIDSNSIYLDFYCKDTQEQNFKWNRCCTLRISDHHLPTYKSTQFIIDCGKVLTKKKKELFFRTLQNCVRKAKNKHLEYEYKSLQKANENRGK